MVQARKINEITVGGVNISGCRDLQTARFAEPRGHHNNFKVEVDPTVIIIIDYNPEILNNFDCN